MKIGLLGAGRAGLMHARILAHRVDELVIAEPKPERSAAVVAELEAEAATRARISEASVEATLTDTTLDALVLTSPTDVHAEQLLRGMELGIPMFTEKPVSTSLASTLKVREAARKQKARIQGGFQRRFDTAYTRARAAVREESLGQLRRLSMGTMDQAPAAREFLAASGGIYIDCLIHDFDMLRWGTGREVTEVMAFGTDLGLPDFRDFGDVCETAAVLRLEGDVLATAQSSRFNGHGYDVRMELHGTKQTLAVGFDNKLPVRSLEDGVSYPEGAAWVDFIARFAACYEREIEAFLEVVAGRGEIPATVDDAVASLRIAEAVRFSQREHRVVSLAEIEG